MAWLSFKGWSTGARGPGARGLAPGAQAPSVGPDEPTDGRRDGRMEGRTESLAPRAPAPVFVIKLS
ncbi:hypothetical protein U9M48_000704 [Paspalum notatum var. saurae]|uniref:Uncharacterized protein n=1 Tax=Paspalum notatum var. saurae TaxID=547442 RepID=A0AAQ3SEQ5_PASNO